MERVRISDDLSFSRIAYGLMRLTECDDVSVRQIQAKVEACLEQGITTIDQADIYGGYGCEEAFGEAIKDAQSLRGSIEIVTKCGIVDRAGPYSDAAVKHYDTTTRHIEEAVDRSLRLMRIERLDLLLVHRPDPLMDHEETGACLDRLVASGKTRAVGVSNFRPWDWELLQSAMATPLATNQIELSLAAHQPFTNGDIAFHQRSGTPVMAWSPLAGGQLTRGGSTDGLARELDRVAEEHGTSSAAIAIAWLLAHPARVMPIMGSNSLRRIRNFSEASRIQIDRETWFRLYSASLGKPVP